MTGNCTSFHLFSLSRAPWTTRKEINRARYLRRYQRETLRRRGLDPGEVGCRERWLTSREVSELPSVMPSDVVMSVRIAMSVAPLTPDEMGKRFVKLMADLETLPVDTRENGYNFASLRTPRENG